MRVSSPQQAFAWPSCAPLRHPPRAPCHCRVNVAAACTRRQPACCFHAIALLAHTFWQSTAAAVVTRWLWTEYLGRTRCATRPSNAVHWPTWCQSCCSGWTQLPPTCLPSHALTMCVFKNFSMFGSYGLCVQALALLVAFHAHTDVAVAVARSAARALHIAADAVDAIGGTRPALPVTVSEHPELSGLHKLIRSVAQALPAKRPLRAGLHYVCVRGTSSWLSHGHY